MLLSANEEELRELCERSSYAVLGGCGFSGLNPRFNAVMGLYRGAIKYEEDIERSRRFNAVYAKMLEVFPDGNLIVLTHNPKNDWNDGSYNPHWIYVNGHTHQNQLLNNNEATVYADNQIGCGGNRWLFKAFPLGGIYDPFSSYEDGLYSIRAWEYDCFMQGRGIMMASFSQPGELIMAKRKDVYLFFLVQNGGDKLFILNGAQKVNAKHELGYYFQYMLDYAEAVNALIGPYRAYLEEVSYEVKRLGGTGKVHGGIVDIDRLNHLFVNPFDGTMVFYWAQGRAEGHFFGLCEPIVCRTLSDLLEYSPNPPMLVEANEVHKKGDWLIELDDDGIARGSESGWDLDRMLHKISRPLKSIQDLLDNNVIRKWNDDILSENDPFLSELRANQKLPPIPIGAEGKGENGKQA